ncbi:cGMP-specific phosphodiesterase [Cavenderia fasciculata]|uniref:cGMP-specific phosphodiesterase n=1 Tax=Cavenderia fasciculata TaxID=261658 RepID=F4PP12_CACFS|nr:cGMP-specific phosphodiesterase [Cavenderia fasciculata]EGG22125.1 cGMP-specific phosphodiesterase [Cavenderia fasciculata]|eukprot:XP_004359976.1 cGMP-specific phosphodiesterase [Cavenderia fasciculata]
MGITASTNQNMNTTDNNNNNHVNSNNNNNNNNNNNMNNSINSSDEEKKKEIFSMDFSAWKKDPLVLVEYSVLMFEEMGVGKELQVNRNALLSYITSVQTNYRNNPFHSFNHAVTVTQMVFLIILRSELNEKLTILEKLSLLIAAVSHDLDHPGLTNRFQINSKSELAVKYNNTSVLENHHLALCLSILGDQKDLLCTLTETDRHTLIEKVKIMILATDMEKHFAYKQKFDEIIPIFSWDDQQHRDLLLIMLLKSADISNEIRSWDISTKWAHALMEEFFAQSDREKQENLPLTPFMLREQVVLNITQVSFIDKFLLPSYQALQIILPSLSVYVDRINKNRILWEQLPK